MNGIQKLTFTLVGESSLLMQNRRMADPMDACTKRLKEHTSKRQKTDDDHVVISHHEFIGHLYANDEIGPYVPGEWIEAALAAGASRFKQKKQIKAGVFATDDPFPLQYAGPRDPEKLWLDRAFVDVRGVKLQGSKCVMRTRPIFRSWSVTAHVLVNVSVISADHVLRALGAAGVFEGIGTYRPKYGRFTVKL